MTHDLIRNMLAGLQAHVCKVVVSELRNDVFHATIWLDKDGLLTEIDSRPSDAIALALRVDCPIFVNDEVFEFLRTVAPEHIVTEELNQWLESRSEEDLGHFKM